MQLQTQGQIESKKDVILYSGFDEIGGRFGQRGEGFVTTAGDVVGGQPVVPEARHHRSGP